VSMGVQLPESAMLRFWPSHTDKKSFQDEVLYREPWRGEEWPSPCCARQEMRGQAGQRGALCGSLTLLREREVLPPELQRGDAGDEHEGAERERASGSPVTQRCRSPRA